MVDIINVFANRYSGETQKKTKSGYISTLTEYFDIIKKKPIQSYFKQTQKQYMKDLEKFFTTLQQPKKITYFKTDKSKTITNLPTTIQQKMSRVKHFLAINRIMIPLNIWEDFSNRNTGHKKPISKKLTFKPDELRSVLQNANQMYTTLFLTMSRSGIRIEGGLEICEDDLNLDTEPPSIELQASYTKTNEEDFT